MGLDGEEETEEKSKETVDDVQQFPDIPLVPTQQIGEMVVAEPTEEEWKTIKAKIR